MKTKLQDVMRLCLVAGLSLIALTSLTAQVQLGGTIFGEGDYDASGSSVSMSADGNMLAIGAPYNNSDSTGHVRIYKYDGITWYQLGGDIDGAGAGDQLGTSVSLITPSYSDPIVAIGAPGNNNTIGYVRIYQFSYVSNTWYQLGSDLDGEAIGDGFGQSVSLFSNGVDHIIAIGAPYSGQSTGRVQIYKYIYDYNSSNYIWSQLGSNLDGEGFGDYSGTSVSLSSNGFDHTIAIGAPDNGQGAGHVDIYKYTYDPNSGFYIWNQLGTDIDGEALGDYSGTSVSLSSDGTRVAIGAPYNDGNGTYGGHVRIYEYNPSVNDWVQLGGDIDGEGYYDQLGFAVSLSSDGTRVAIGAPYHDDGTNNVYGAGQVRIYEYSSSGWVQLGSDLKGSNYYIYSGKSVSLSSDGTRFAFGSPNEDNIADNRYVTGSVRAFQLPTSPFGSLHFKTGDHVIASNPNLPQGNAARTIEVWAKESGNTVFEVLANYGSIGFNLRSSLMLVGSTLYYCGDNNDFSVPITTRDGTWHHYAATHNGTTLSLYVDGVLQGQQNMSFNTTGARLDIGQSNGGTHNGGEFFDGNLDELRIWNYARSAAEISDNMNREIAGNTPGLVAYYRFNEGVPNADNTGVTTVPDFSASNADGTLYNFTLSGSTSNWSNSQPSNFLPVTYLHFYGSATASGHRLDWATGMEENNQGFYIERSTDGRRFEAIGWVDGAGTTQARQDYTYLDPTPPAGVAYYRLQQVDYDGTTAYSSVVTVMKRSKEGTVICYPNPVTDQLTIENAPASIATIYNMLGQPVWQQAITSSPFQLSTAALPSGLYTLTIQHSDGRQYTQSLVK